MDFCYAVQAHKNPEQLKRLIDRLDSPNSYFYIHIDLKSDIDKFIKIIGEGRENIYFVEDRLDCIWADFSQVLVSIKLMETILERHNGEGMYIPLTGQCYPIKPLSHTHQFLEKNKHLNFIEVSKIEKLWNQQEIFKRLKRYRFNYSSERGQSFHLDTIRDFKTFVICLKYLRHKLINIPQFVDTFFKRKLKLDLEFYGGNSMFVLNLDTLRRVITYIRKHQKELYSYFRYTTCADEIFFQTIIVDMMKKDPSIQIVPYDTIHIDWEEFGSSDNMCFRKKHLESLLSRPDYELTARKFDINEDSEILDLLDEHNQYR